MKNITDFLVRLQERDRQKMLLGHAEEQIEKKKEEFILALKEICIKALQEYNGAGDLPYKVDTESVDLDIDIDNRTVIATVKLCNRSGLEPLDELDVGDLERMTLNFEPIFNLHMVAHGVPFKFNRFAFPEDYFMALRIG